MYGLTFIVEEEEFERFFPYVTWIIIFLNTIVFILELANPSIVMQYAFIPSQFFRGERLETLITHMFLHASFIHIFTNMYFAYVFCDDLENVYGHANFLLFYLVSGIGAAIIHAILTPTPNIPSIGASGALFGVMAAYAVFFPKRRLYVFLGYYYLRIKAIYFAFFYFIIESLYVALGIVDYVAHTAHVGGFITGLILALIYKHLKKPRIYKTPQHWW